MGGRAVEGTGLENQQARKRLVGSNPTSSAIAGFYLIVRPPKGGASHCAGAVCEFTIAKEVVGHIGVEFTFLPKC